MRCGLEDPLGTNATILGKWEEFTITLELLINPHLVPVRRNRFLGPLARERAKAV